LIVNIFYAFNGILPYKIYLGKILSTKLIAINWLLLPQLN